MTDNDSAGGETIAGPGSVPIELILGGHLQHAETGYPLEGLRIVAKVRLPDGASMVVAAAVSGVGGRFRLVSDDPDQPIGGRRESLVLEVSGRSGDVWLRTADLRTSLGSDSLALGVPVPAVRPTAAHWADFAARLMERRHTRLHEAIRHLVLAPVTESVVGDWAIELRHAMALTLERALIDPTGVLGRRAAPPTFTGVHARDEWDTYRRRVESPPDMAVTAALDRAVGVYGSYPAAYRADWELELDALAAGSVGVAVVAFEDLYRDDSTDTIPLPFRNSPLVPYRDYLRTLFTGGSKSDEDALAKLEALETRFHQRFTTSDGLTRPANGILAGIIREILIAPTGDQYGFGIAPADIEPRGSRTHREYLDYLIGLSGVSPGELGKRYRLDFARPDAALSTPVEENIATLQGFYRDGFQSKADPFPVIDDMLLGRAPFFLYLEEWLLRTGPFYAENLHRFTDTYTCGVRPADKAKAASEADNDPDGKWYLETVQAETKIAEGHTFLRQGEYELAAECYREAERLAGSAFQASIEAYRARTPSKTIYEAEAEMRKLVEALGAELRALPLAAEADLVDFDGWVRWRGHYIDVKGQSGDFAQWMTDDIGYRWLALVRLRAFVLPACLGDVAAATGDYAGAIGFFSFGTLREVGRGPHDIVPPYREFAGEESGSYTTGILYRLGPLAYTIETSQPHSILEGSSTALLANRYHGHLLHPMEQRWLELRQADALVRWADALYRTDEAASIERARELYKAALFVLGASPHISPRWDGPPTLQFGNGTENPALIVLKGEARKGIAQIDAGLNYYGADDSLVPHLRYRTLKDAADRFASAGKSAEGDLLAYIGKIEDALVEQMLQANMLTKAQLQASIAGEQAEIAEFEVGLAQRQVAAVEAEIKRKKEELEDESGLFEQFVDFVGGMKDAITDLPSGLTGFAASGAQATASGASLTGSAALTAGSGMMAGYGIFVYAGITSLTAVADNLESLEKQISTLENDALPLARAQVEARQRQVTIANLQQQIAEADAALARELIHFAQLRFLNVDFWVELAALTRRILRRYLFLGGRFTWLAERALAYEQDRVLDIVRLDYAPIKYQGITGAGQLLADLSELEATRLDGLRQALPVRRTWSLAFDFPTQFAQLKATGQCEIHTSDALLRLAYPGTYAHRIETVRVRPQNVQGVNPYRGLLRNTGLSTVTRADGSPHLSVRFEDALPLTESGADGWVATPGSGETLGLFEGSGVDTTWVLELPAAANPYGIADLADVLFTVEARALYSDELHDETSTPTSVQKYLAVSAAKHWPDAVAAIRDPQVATVTVPFNLTQLGLPAAEQDREITNAFVILAGPGDGAGSLQVKAASQPAALTVPLTDNVALSNAGPLAAGQPALPLNALVGLSAAQQIAVSLTKSEFAGTDLTRVNDVILGIEYTAELGG